MKRFRLFFLLFIALISQLALGQSHQLFFEDQRGSINAHENYAQIMDQLVKDNGGVIKLSNNQEYKLIRFLGAGNTNLIFELEDGRAIRLGHSISNFYDFNTSITYLRSFYDGYKKLSKNGIKVPKVYLKESLKNEAIIIEKLDVLFTLKEFKREQGKAKKLDDTEKLDILKKLKHFQNQTKNYRHLGDFHEGQLIYDGHNWVLLDWNDLSILSKDSFRMNNAYILINQTLSLYKHLLPGPIKEIKKASWCNHLFENLSYLFKSSSL